MVIEALERSDVEGFLTLELSETVEVVDEVRIRFMRFKAFASFLRRLTHLDKYNSSTKIYSPLVITIKI